MIKKLLALNGLAITGAVLYHAAGWGFVAMFWWADQFRPVAVPDFGQLGSFSYYGLRFIEQIIIFAIPAFLFVSGYFVAFASGKAGVPPWKWIFARIKYLAIPYLIWSAVILLMNFVFGERFRIQSLLPMLLTGKTTEAFYFIPLIIQLYLLSPLLTRLVKSKPYLILAAAFLLTLLIHLGQAASMLGISYPGRQMVSYFLPAWFFPGNVFWFVLGIYIGFHYATVQEKLAGLRTLFIAACLVMIPLGIWEWEALLTRSGQEWYPSRESTLDIFYSLFFLLIFITFNLSALARQKWLNYLGGKTFGIYLSHTLFLTLTAKVAYNLVPQILQYQIIFQPILVLSGLLGPILLMEIVKKTALKNLYGYIFG